MIRGILTVLTFISILFFPWPLSVLLALVASVYEPLIPLAAGVFFEVLYYSPNLLSGGDTLPLFALGGLLATVVAFALHHRLPMR